MYPPILELSFAFVQKRDEQRLKVNNNTIPIEATSSSSLTPNRFTGCILKWSTSLCTIETPKQYLHLQYTVLGYTKHLSSKLWNPRTLLALYHTSSVARALLRTLNFTDVIVCIVTTFMLTKYRIYIGVWTSLEPINCPDYWAVLTSGEE